MAKMIAVRGPLKDKEFSLQDVTVLGRSFDTDVRIDDLTVSRQHAKVTRSGNGYIIEDMGSGNGTFVNGRRVSAPMPLRDNDVIKISQNLFRFVAIEQEEARASASTGAVDVSELDSNIVDTVDVKRTLVDMAGARAESPAAAAQAHQRLKTVAEIAQRVQSVLDMDELLAGIMDSLFAIFPQADRGFIMLQDEDSEELTPVVTRNRSQTGSAQITVSRHIVKEVTSKRVAVLSADAMGDQRFSAAQSVVSFQIRSMMCVPLVAQEELLGIINVDTMRQDARFGTDDLELLTVVANQMALAIANARLHERLLKRERVERDMRLARQVQHSFLPESVPDVPGMEFCAHYNAALDVGGDFYDFIFHDENRLSIVVGDVSGKGVPAALLMAKMTSDVRFYSMMESEPKDVLAHVNDRMASSRNEDAFVTLLYMTLYIDTKRLTVCNAAHPPPVVRRAEEANVIEINDLTNFPIGVMPGLEFEQQDFQLEPGDVVSVFSDGVTEAMNANKDQFGDERVHKAVAAAPPRAKAIMERLLERVKEYVGDTPQSDDLTLVSFGVLKE